MKNMFNSSKGNGNGVNTTNRCMGCTKDCESCFFKDVAGQFNKAVEEGGPVMEKDQQEVERQVALCEEDMNISSSENFPLSDVDKVLIHYFNEIFEIDEEHEKHDGKNEERKKEPILCKPYLVTIKAIYHEYYGHMDWIIFRLATDAMGNVIKEPWSPHSPNPDGRLDSLVFGVSLHHMTDINDGIFELAEDALELCTEHEGEDGSDTTQEIIYQAGPNFMTKTIEIDPDGMVAIVRKIDSMFMKKELVVAVFEMIKSNGENEYFIGLPTIDIPARKI
jgi:hypothetical protein